VLTAINRQGHATGHLDAYTAVFWDGQQMNPIPAAGNLRMQHGTAINDKDEIVGVGAAGTRTTLLLYSGGTLVDIVPLIENARHWEFSPYGRLTGINERGEISGVAYHHDGSGVPSQRAFVLMPMA